MFIQIGPLTGPFQEGKMDDLVRRGNNMMLVRWLALWDQREGCKTLVDVFASARHVAAPYPVLIRLTVVGTRAASAIPPVTLDGAKVNEPLRVCLDEVFTTVRGLAGVIIELIPTRRSLDLTLSRCVVERKSGDRIVKYMPWLMPLISKPARNIAGTRGPEMPAAVASYPFHRNDHETLSLVAFNWQDESTALRVGLRGVSVDSSIEILEQRELESIAAVNVGSNSVVELSLRCRDNKVAISLAEPRQEEIAVYMVGRSTATGDLRTAVSFVVNS